LGLAWQLGPTLLGLADKPGSKLFQKVPKKGLVLAWVCQGS